MDNFRMKIFMLFVVCPILGLAVKWNTKTGGECTNWKSVMTCVNLTYVPEFPSEHDIFTLKISWSSLPEIDDIDFGDALNLIQISMVHCNIETIAELAFSGLVQLLEVDLSHNNISYLHDSTFIDNTGLFTLDLSYNLLDKIDPKKPFLVSESIGILNMSHCKITSLSEKTFSQLRYVMVLDLSYNLLTTIGNTPLEAIMPKVALKLDHNRWTCGSNFKTVACSSMYNNFNCIDKYGNKNSYFCNSIGKIKETKDADARDLIRIYMVVEDTEDHKAENRFRDQYVNKMLSMKYHRLIDDDDDDDDDEENPFTRDYFEL